MSKPLSLKVDENIFLDIETILQNLKDDKKKISRNNYINEALKSYNRHMKREILRKQLQEESERVADHSLRILQEFDSAHYDYE